jgi:hypothetical protein
MNRILLAAALGGLTIYVWTSIAHMFLPIGTMGASTLPNEDAVMSALTENVPAPGMYFFPGWDMSREMTAEEEAEWMEKHRTGPAGFMIYKPVGGEAMPPSMFITEFVSNLLAALLLALVAASLAGAYMRRVLLLSLFGLFAWFSLSASYWAWYRFPTVFVIGEGIDVFVGALLGAFVIAKLVPPPATAPPATTPVR